MYYPNVSHIVETDDYLRLHEHTIEKRKDGRVFSHQVIELNPNKEYDHESDMLTLHVTNGASHRHMRVEPEESVQALKARRAEENAQDADERLRQEEARGVGQGSVLGSEPPAYHGERDNLAEQKRRDDAATKKGK